LPPVLSLQAESADLSKRLAAAHESLAQSQLDLAEAQQLLQDTRNTVVDLEARWGAMLNGLLAGHCHSCTVQLEVNTERAEARTAQQAVTAVGELSDSLELACGG
jgi:hypothetical protein